MANLDIVRGRQVVVPLTNRSGTDSVAGDVVVLDSANDEAYVTTTTAAFTGIIGVVQETIVSLGVGRVLIAGYAPLVNVLAAVTRGQFAETSATAKKAQSNATRHVGSFGQWVKAGTTPSAVLWGLADSSAGVPPTLTVEEVDGTPTDPAVTKVVFPNGSLAIASHVATYTPAAVATPARAIEFIIDGGGSAITAGIKGDVEVPFACTITAWRVFADQAGTITVGIWKDSYANFPPVVGDLLVSPALSAADHAQATGLSLALAAGDILRFNANATPASVTRVTVSLTVS